MYVNKGLIALIVGILAVVAGAVAAFVILRKKFSKDEDFDEFEDFDMLDDDEFFDEDEFFGEDDGYSEYVIGSDNSMPATEKAAEEEETDAADGASDL